jgi:hypothetical protein
MTTIIGSTGDSGRSIMAIQSEGHGTRQSPHQTTRVSTRADGRPPGEGFDEAAGLGAAVFEPAFFRVVGFSALLVVRVRLAMEPTVYQTNAKCAERCPDHGLNAMLWAAWALA